MRRYLPSNSHNNYR